MKNELYLAGGCFWGLQKYLSVIPGVISTQAGYANGKTENPTYQEIGATGHAETVKVVYDPEKITLAFLLDLFYQAIDPTAFHRQGNDVGSQYRTGIYYTNPQDQPIILESLARLEKQYKEPIVIEVLPLANYAKAEDYHQEYLDKNPGGYCHIRPAQIKAASQTRVDPYRYEKPTQEQLQRKLSVMEFEVTQHAATEPPHRGKYDQHFEPGIYVDVTTGEPMFLSNDKFDAGCGWPSFSKPLDDKAVIEKEDNTLGMRRIEVRSRAGDAHLGHVFPDGPKDLGGQRYCINSAALRFVPLADMEEEGYGQYIPLVQMQ